MEHGESCGGGEVRLRERKRRMHPFVREMERVQQQLASVEELEAKLLLTLHLHTLSLHR